MVWTPLVRHISNVSPVDITKLNHFNAAVALTFSGVINVPVDVSAHAR